MIATIPTQFKGSEAESLHDSNPATNPLSSIHNKLSNSEYYLNRELTWLHFNKRVLYEARNPHNPLLERLKFIAIVAANLDEFFMKRIGGLKQQVGARFVELTVDGRTPQQQIDASYRIIRQLESDKDALLPRILSCLENHQIKLANYESLDESARHNLRLYYLENIFPLITPQVVDPAHPFPFISNLSLNLLVTLQAEAGSETALARIKVPVGTGIKRFIPINNSMHFVPLEEIITHNLDLLFPGVKIIACEKFNVARNASTEFEETSANDLLAMIELELRERRFAPIVRVVVEKGMNVYRRGLLTAELGLEEADVFETDCLMTQSHLFEIASLPLPELHDPTHHPVTHHLLRDKRSIFHMIRDADSLLLQHPYESFATSVVKFLEEASRDPKVHAIKMTLYRTTQETRIVDLLIEAARNGKQVAVVIELKAKFDEAANIEWSGRMEAAGVHVTYGVIGLKTHCKVLLVVRRDYSGLRRYVHIGTGNYHGGTARLYTDLGLLTCNEEVGRDVTELFNYLTTGYTPKRNYSTILPAPKLLKKTLLKLIKNEIETHNEDDPGLIQIKTNALEDSDITKALYLASTAGVKVELIVRDSNRIRPGIKGLSENITVISVVGRFLEHSRIFHFKHGGDQSFLIGSADLMKRNLESRVEVVVQIQSPKLRKELQLILDTLLDDQVNTWEMHADGSYIRRSSGSTDQPGCQSLQIVHAQKRLKSKAHNKLLRSNARKRRN